MLCRGQYNCAFSQCVCSSLLPPFSSLSLSDEFPFPELDIWIDISSHFWLSGEPQTMCLADELEGSSAAVGFGSSSVMRVISVLLSHPSMWGLLCMHFHKRRTCLFTICPGTMTTISHLAVADTRQRTCFLLPSVGSSHSKPWFKFKTSLVSSYFVPFNPHVRWVLNRNRYTDGYYRANTANMIPGWDSLFWAVCVCPYVCEGQVLLSCFIPDLSCDESFLWLVPTTFKVINLYWQQKPGIVCQTILCLISFNALKLKLLMFLGLLFFQIKWVELSGPMKSNAHTIAHQFLWWDFNSGPWGQILKAVNLELLLLHIHLSLTQRIKTESVSYTKIITAYTVIQKGN